MTGLRVFVVDDEEPARRKLVRFLADDGGCLLVGEAASGEEAVHRIAAARPDLLFLDVQMKRMNGLDVARALDPASPPRIVFVTAYDEYALEAFDVHAFDYLLKPFDRTRFARVLADIRRTMSQERRGRELEVLRLLAERQEPRRLLVEKEERAFFLTVESIDWAEAERNHVHLHAGGEVHTVRSTIESMAERLGSARFLRINRSTLVRIDFIRELHRWSHGEYKVVLQSGATLTWTRRYVRRGPDPLKL